MKLILIAFKYLKRYPLLAVIVLFTIIVASLFEGASFGMLIPLIQSMISKGANVLEKIPFIGRLALFSSSMSQIRLISFIFASLLFLLLTKNIFIYLSNVLIAKLRFGIIRDFRLNLMEHLLEYDAKFFDSVKTGHIITNLNIETQRIGNFILSVLQFLVLSGRVLVYVLLLFLISWKVSIVIFLLIAVVLLVIEVIMKRIEIGGVRLSQALANYNYKLTEILGGIRLIRGRGTEGIEKRNFKTATDKICHIQYRNSKYIHLIIPLCEVLIFGIIVLCFLFLINVIKIDLASTFPFIAIYLLVLARTLTQLNALNGNRSAAVECLAAFGSYEKMYDERGKMTIKSGDRKIKGFSDSIMLKNVNFSYISGREVLKDINIKIPKGKITALVGASGAGKSTIVNLIPRFYDINSGSLRVDGIDIKELTLRDWRRKIGFVSQDVFIFNTSVRNNISYGYADIPEGEVIKAAKTSKAHDFIIDLPDGYNTVLGERGVRLSGGQKQRLSIARAIMHNPEILILDEATSSLDTETERLIKTAIDRLTRDRTVIAIAHRLSTILHADNIIVFDEGRVVEEGTHADLLKKNGLYERLYNAQFNV